MRFLGLSRETVPRALSGKFLSVKIEGKGEKICRRKIFFVEEKKSREGIGGKYFEKENIWSVEEKYNGYFLKGKGGKYLGERKIEVLADLKMYMYM